MMTVSSVLKLQKLVFDEIHFQRIGFQNKNEIAYEIQIQVGVREPEDYKVTIILNGRKPEEYNFSITLSGFFSVEANGEMEDYQVRNLINKNAVAILIPYLRSEVTILTAQPETESVVLPPFNVNKIFEEQE